MDRHLTYVAMTHHQHSVKLYGVQDRFRDFETLANTLSRARQKQSTLDFVYDDKRQFMEKRQRVTEAHRTRSRFANIALNLN